MLQESELLKAVLEKPNDDAPRLAYAEWCEQQSDPAFKDRGKFIRTQVALARLTEPNQEYNLRHTSEKLEARHRAAWGRTVAPFVDEYRFDRGFIELVVMSAKRFLERAPQLFALAPIRHLILTEVTPVIGILFASPHLRNIHSLELDRCGLGDGDIVLLAACQHLKELRWLSIAYNRVGEDGADALATSPHLKKLAYANFYGNTIQPSEQYSYDNGYVVDSGLSAEGLRLEMRFGHLRWLHHQAKSIEDAIPDRFRIITAD